DYKPATVEPIARGRASSHAETLERAYDILVSFKAGTEAVLNVQDLADELGSSTRAAAGILAELETAGRITRRQAGQYAGLIVGFPGMQINQCADLSMQHTDHSHGQQ